MIDYTGIPNNLSERIKFIRKKHDYKQVDIANKLCVSRATYTKYETGDITIPIAAIIELAKIYSLSTDFILGVSAKPEYINYGDYSIGLSDKASFNLQCMYEHYENAFKAINSLLENRSVFMIFQSLGLLIRIPKNFSEKDLKCDKDLSEMIMHLFYEHSEIEFPAGIFNLSDADSMQFGHINFEMILESYLQGYLRDFIDEKRTLPETKRNFANELIKLYMDRAKKELDEIKEADA